MERLEQILNKDKRAIISQLPKEEQEIAKEIFNKKYNHYLQDWEDRIFKKIKEFESVPIISNGTRKIKERWLIKNS